MGKVAGDLIAHLSRMRLECNLRTSQWCWSNPNKQDSLDTVRATVPEVLPQRD